MGAFTNHNTARWISALEGKQSLVEASRAERVVIPVRGSGCNEAPLQINVQAFLEEVALESDRVGHTGGS